MFLPAGRWPATRWLSSSDMMELCVFVCACGVKRRTPETVYDAVERNKKSIFAAIRSILYACFHNCFSDGTRRVAHTLDCSEIWTTKECMFMHRNDYVYINRLLLAAVYLLRMCVCCCWWCWCFCVQLVVATDTDRNARLGAFGDAPLPPLCVISRCVYTHSQHTYSTTTRTTTPQSQLCI